MGHAGTLLPAGSHLRDSIKVGLDIPIRIIKYFANMNIKEINSHSYAVNIGKKL